MDRGVHLLHLLPEAMTIQSYPLLVKRRGPYIFEGIKLFTRFPFGLFVKAATFPVRSEVMVYPETENLLPFSSMTYRWWVVIRPCPSVDQGRRCIIFGSTNPVMTLGRFIGKRLRGSRC